MALGAGRKGKSPAPGSVETRDSGEPRPDADSAEGTDDATPAEGGTGASSSGSSGVDSTPHVITGRYRPVETWTRAASISSGEASSSRAPLPRGRDRQSVDVEDVDGLPPPTHVHVAVVSCSGLRGSDWTGYADPFVEVGAFGADKKHRYRTSVAKMTPCEPDVNPEARDRFLVAVAAKTTGRNPRRSAGSWSPCSTATGAPPRSSSGARSSPRATCRAGAGGRSSSSICSRASSARTPAGVFKRKEEQTRRPASAPAALGTVTVRIAAADDMSRTCSRTRAPSRRARRLRALAPGKFGANKIRAYAAGISVAHKNVSSKAGAARTLHPKLIRHVHVRDRRQAPRRVRRGPADGRVRARAAGQRRRSARRNARTSAARRWTRCGAPAPARPSR